MVLGPPPPVPPPPRRPPPRPTNEGSAEYVARQVSGALRAAARGRRQRHQKPRDVVLKAFARFSEDGRVSPSEFVAGCELLGLTVPIADALAVFINAPSEFVMESDRDKENARGGADDGIDEEGTETGAEKHADDVLLLYAPWIDDVLEGPPRTLTRPRQPPPTAPRASTSGRTSPPASNDASKKTERKKTERGKTEPPPPPPRMVGYAKPVAPSQTFRTRRGPLTEHDPPVKDGDAFVYPHCRTPVFPPDGFDQTHVARGGVLPDCTLELDHVHGCGPGLVDRTAPVPVFCVAPRAGESPDGKARDPERTGNGPGIDPDATEECVYYAAGVCVVQTLRDPRAVLAERAAENRARDELAARRKRQYMAGVDMDPVPPKSWDRSRCQRHFRGHVDDVRCLTVHEGSRRCASGEMGVQPRAIVWRVDAESTEAPLAVLKHPKGARAVICVGFNSDCSRLVTVCGDDGHTVSMWDWNSGPLLNPSLPGGTRAGTKLWQARGYQSTPPAVRGAMFTPDLTDKDAMITFGSKHIKFWTPPPREPRPPGGVGDVEADRSYQKLPWRARGGQWVPNATVEDVLCAAFLPWVRVRAKEVDDEEDTDDDASSVRSGPPGEDNLVRGVNLVTGSPKGRILFWEKGDGVIPVTIVPGSDWHKAGVSALALSSDNRLLLSGDKGGGVMCWAVNASYATIVAPLGGMFLVENPPKPLPPTPPPSVSASEVWLEGDDEYPGPGWEYEGEPLRWLESYPDVRGACWSPSGRYALITTAQGSVWRILIDPKLTEGEETESEETEDEDKPVEKLTELAILRLEYAAAVKENAKQPVVSVLIRGHDSSLNALAWWQGGKFASSGTQAMYATGAGSGRTVIWNAWTRTELAAFDAGGPVRSLAFSPDGHHLAVGLDKGTVNVFGILAWKQPDPDYLSTGDAWFNIEVRFLYACVGSLKASVGALGYSPDGRWLAGGDQLGGLELYRTKAKPGDEELRPAYSRRAKCSGHSSAVLHVDWTECSRCVRSGSTSYELLYHLVPSGQLLPRAPRYGVDSREPTRKKEKKKKDEDDDSASEEEPVDPTHDAHALLEGYESDDDGRGGWHTWTSPLGFEVMGVWQEGQDGTDVNEVWRSVDGKRLFSADDSGQVRVVNYPCVLARAPSHGHRAHSSHVTAARGSWCDEWVASSGGRDCCVMQWRVTPARVPTDRMEGYFETPRHRGLVRGVGSGLTGFDLTDIDAGVVSLRVVDRPTARIVRGKTAKKTSAKKTSAKKTSNARVAGDEDDEDDEDDGIWNAKREDDIAEMDEPVDLLADAEAVVPVHKLKADAKVARYAAEFVKSAPGPTRMWATREEVAERRRRLETELRKLGKERQASSIGGGPAAGRMEWGVPVIRGGEIPEQPRREPRIKFGPYQSERPLLSHQKPFYYPPEHVSDAGTFSDAGDDA